MRQALMRRLALASLLAALALPGIAAAQEYPTRPIRLLVAYAPGGGADIMARLLAVPLARELGQQIVVENRTGAGGAIGSEACARSAPDGYTICMGSTATHSILPHLANLPWDPIRDFTAIINLAFQPNVIAVNPNVPVRTLQEFVDWAKRNRGTVYGTSGIGTSNHLAGAYLSSKFDLGMEHVAYRGGNLAQQDAIAGQIPVVLDQITAMVPHFQSGKLRPIAIAGSPRRSALLPDVPTIQEAVLPDFRVESYQAIFAPAGLPAPIVRRLNDAIRNAVNNSDVRQRFIGMGSDPVLNQPEEFAAYLRETSPMYRELVRISGARTN